MRVLELIKQLEAYAKLYGNNEIYFEKYDSHGYFEELKLHKIDKRSDDECVIEFEER